jgi:ribosomal protein S18 acetylase RimI-like enzyme
MQGLLMEGRSLSDDWHFMHIGEFTFRFFMIACHLNPSEQIRLWHNEQGKLIGYAILGEDPFFDCQVLPGYEWQGIEEEAIAWAEAFLAALRQLDPSRWSGDTVAFARQDNGRRRVFLGQHGFRYHGEFAEVNLLRTLHKPLPAPSLAEGYQLRSLAETGEINARAAAHRQVWLPWTDGEVSDADYERFSRLPAFSPDLDVFAVAPDGTVAAFVNGWIDPLNHIGELGSVGAVPGHRQKGLTRAVLLECLRRMQKLGMDRACVSTGVSNIPAIRLYQSIGFEVHNQTLDYRKTFG